MTDGGAVFQPGERESPVPIRPRGTFAGHEVFGHEDSVVLVEPEVQRDLRLAAEFASQEGRVTGGLLYGRRWADEQGVYLVVSGYVEAGPGENPDDRISRDSAGEFTLSPADLRLLRKDAARMYTASPEVGWWRSLPAAGGFGPRDFETQAELVGPGGVGLLVYGSGEYWGTAYHGPDGLATGPSGSLVPLPRPLSETRPDLELGPDFGFEPEPEPGASPDPDVEPGGVLATRRQATVTPVPQPTAPRAYSPVGVPTREWRKQANPSYVEPRTPTDVKIVIGALVIVAIVAAIMVGLLLSNAVAAVIIGVVGLLAITAFLWLARL